MLIASSGCVPKTTMVKPPKPTFSEPVVEIQEKACLAKEDFVELLNYIEDLEHVIQ